MEADGEIVKRIIALPDETVYVKDGQLYIDGSVVREPIDVQGNTENFGPVKLADDEYFVMGDNREASSDSRVYGALKIKQINAKAYL